MSNIKSIFSSIFGNTLEWYDFALYGSLASFIGMHFFPAKNTTTSLLMTFGAFAAGFLMRPLGGMFFGHIGDTGGRRKALLYSVGLIAVSTTLIGLVPDYQQVGLWAPVLIVIIRLLQGLAMGGELTGAMVYLAETAPHVKKRSFYASFSALGIFTGILLAPVFILIVSGLQTSHTFSNWGWRLPFLFSGILGTIIFYLRSSLNESPEFNTSISKQKNNYTPLLECIKNYKYKLMIAVGVSVQVGISFWITMVYNITYFTQILHWRFHWTLLLNLFMIAVAATFTPLIGKLSEYIKSSSLLLFFAACFIVMAIPINYIIIDWNCVDHKVITILLMFIVSLNVAGYLAVIPGFLVSLFPAQVRYSGIAISYNLALAVFGGTMPLLVTYLLKNQHILIAPGIVLTVGGLISFVSLWLRLN